MDEVGGVRVGRMEGEKYKNGIVYINEDVYIWCVGVRKYTIYWEIFVVCG